MVSNLSCLLVRCFVTEIISIIQCERKFPFVSVPFDYLRLLHILTSFWIYHDNSYRFDSQMTIWKVQQPDCVNMDIILSIWFNHIIILIALSVFTSVVIAVLVCECLWTIDLVVIQAFIVTIDDPLANKID